jgi:uncharacterized membrane protein
MSVALCKNQGFGNNFALFALVIELRENLSEEPISESLQD